ncbi:MAG: permease [Polyangiaceae bacterium]
MTSNDAGQAGESERPSAVPQSMRVTAVVLLVTAVSALFYYKWAAAFRAYGGVEHTGTLSVNPSLILQGGPWVTTLAYFTKIWPALVYGIVIGAVVRATVPPSWVARALGSRGLKGALLGGLAGAPLMLCSCCVTPIFTGLHERGARLSSSLGVMLGAPGFNLAAIALSFALLPRKVAVGRAICAVLIVLGLPVLIGHVDSASPAKGYCGVESAEARTLGEIGQRFVRSLVYLTAVTLPLIVFGVVFGGLALPYVTHLNEVGVVLGVVLVALAATLAALPTFFEIPIALILLQLGAPAGAALAVVIAGPIVNLPSLFVLGRETSPRLAVGLAFGVWIIASLAGITVSI